MQTTRCCQEIFRSFESMAGDSCAIGELNGYGLGGGSFKLKSVMVAFAFVLQRV